MYVFSWLVAVAIPWLATVSAFQHSFARPTVNLRRHDLLRMQLAVMVNGMPGPMAVEVAKACLDRGFTLVPTAFTGPNQPNSVNVVGAKSQVQVELVPGPGIGNDADMIMKNMKAKYPDMVVVDYTHPSAILNNLKCYVDNNCEFVMGTTGGDPTQMTEIFSKGSNFAVIAPNMGKQIVALQAALQAMATRFPGSFADYKLTVRDSNYSPLLSCRTFH